MPVVLDLDVQQLQVSTYLWPCRISHVDNKKSDWLAWLLVFSLKMLE